MELSFEKTFAIFDRLSIKEFCTDRSLSSIKSKTFEEINFSHGA